MNAENYSRTLLQILRQHTAEALTQMQKINSGLPEKATGIAIGVHPNQEPDGMFSILVHLEGSDLYSINKAIDGHRYLFDVQFKDGELTPKVPLFDPFDTEFEVNDIIVDTSVIWLKEIWSKIDDVGHSLPVTVFGDEYYGTITPATIR